LSRPLSEEIKTCITEGALKVLVYYADRKALTKVGRCRLTLSNQRLKRL